MIETIGSQYCSHWSSARVTRYISFREPKQLESWECRQACAHRKVVLSKHTIQTTNGAIVSHTIFLIGNWKDNSICEGGEGVISFPNGKTMGGQATQGFYEITLREEFAKMNELTGSITLSFGIQARVSDKRLVDSLEGVIV